MTLLLLSDQKSSSPTIPPAVVLPLSAASDSEACSSDGWSDIDIEDITAVKFRARTPPWQRAEENAARARLLMLQRPAPSTCMLWDTSESEQRLVEVGVCLPACASNSTGVWCKT